MIQPSKEELAEQNAEVVEGDGTGVIQYDEYLKPYASQLRARYSALQILKRDVINFVIL